MPSRTFLSAGFGAALIGLFVTLGGHWAVLQSVAWARMLAEFSRTESLGTAIQWTFDGKHPCPMRLKIRAGREQEQRQAPVLKWERLPEFVVQTARTAAPYPPQFYFDAAGFVPDRSPDLVCTPPKPPPRPV